MMKTSTITSLFATSVLWLSAEAWGHSAMFTDGFSYDDSNGGGGNPAMDRLLTTDSFSANSTSATCAGGSANGYPCENIDLLSFVPKANMGGGSANLSDIWGYTDPQTGAEIAIVGRTNGTSFVDVTDGNNPVFLGFLPSHNNGNDSWRDIKTYDHYAFIVADGSGNRTHGLQVFDLSTLRNVTPGSTLSETAHMDGFGIAHNIVINEATSYAYIVGSNQCSGGLYMVDISDPLNPTYSGCFSSDGYTHDAQCVIYNGPDTDYTGKEICVGYNEDTITIVDVTSKSNPYQISRTTYAGSQYTHQGWFADDNHAILIMNDELDEQYNGHNTTSYIYDVSNLDRPVELGRYAGPTAAIDHNLYTLNGYIFESNYRAGLRILDAADITNGNLRQVGYFDTIPASNSAQFSGTWSNYIYFASGNIITSDIGNGLFTVKPDWDAIAGSDPDPDPIAYCSASGNDASYEWISQVDIGGFSNSSGADSYSDFTSQTINLTTGESSVSLVPAFSGSSYGEFWKIWIDLNGDGDFNDTGEEVFSSAATSTTTVTGSLSIPVDTTAITTRLRVSMKYNGAPDPCGTFDYGEVEDYTVSISSGDGDGGSSDTTFFENVTAVSIPDNNNTGIYSALTVTGNTGATTVSVTVDVTHTYIGDLIVDLVDPQGNSYNLHNRTGGSADNLQQSYSVTLTGTTVTGEWQLRVRDLARQDSGTLNRWSLQF
ncbi:choice-of-anchor B family protein [Gynuella sunshinyii]|uniref:Regulatory P domain of the subtilisin-like proprotein convertases and other protease n=1 Tax=Gynuella sunshinyii YC6258 TaxID=1445510 RepID=A0A0C5VTZ5_9GAMM|nr:choice-of-anchor B family protein [Gynuella sunshinyii]AJQ97656.1 regulatory P domain of the subtilisin-like proprotein convertases and other protease [Gynuella sunshinyii YC6258]